MILHGRNADNSIHIGKFRLCKSAEKNCSEAGLYYSYLALYRISPPLYTPVIISHAFTLCRGGLRCKSDEGSSRAEKALRAQKKRRVHFASRRKTAE